MSKPKGMSEQGYENLLRQNAWIATYYPMAVNATDGTPILPELVMAVALLESSKVENGNRYPGGSELAEKGNNLFGIKATNWNGRKIKLKTIEYVGYFPVPQFEEFRFYNSKSESFEDFVNLLMTASRYKPVRDADTIEGQADAMQASGYATDPNYATKVKLASIAVTNALEEIQMNDSKNKPKKSSPLVMLAGFGLLAWAYNN